MQLQQLRMKKDLEKIDEENVMSMINQKKQTHKGEMENELTGRAERNFQGK